MVGEVTVLLCCTERGEARGKNRIPSAYQEAQDGTKSGQNLPSGASQNTEYASLAQPGEASTVRAGRYDMQARANILGPCKFVANGFEQEGLS
jgi:hypothetical protein